MALKRTQTKGFENANEKTTADRIFERKIRLQP